MINPRQLFLLIIFAGSIFGQENNTEDLNEVSEEILQLSFEPDKLEVAKVLPTNRPWIVGHRGASGMVTRFFSLFSARSGHYLIFFLSCLLFV